jgi:hypothetical protein
MKTLFLLIGALFVAPAFAQMTCTTYLGGVTDCWGTGGYNAEYRQHLGGTTSYYDNRGNSGNVQQYSGGITTVVGDPGSRTAVPPPVVYPKSPHLPEDWKPNYPVR